MRRSSGTRCDYPNLSAGFGPPYFKIVGPLVSQLMADMIDRFAKDAAALDAMYRVLASARKELGEGTSPRELASALFGASMKALEDPSSPIASHEFAKLALQTIIDLQDDAGSH